MKYLYLIILSIVLIGCSSSKNVSSCPAYAVGDVENPLS